MRPTTRTNLDSLQCFGSGSVRIRIKKGRPDPDHAWKYVDPDPNGEKWDQDPRIRIITDADPKHC